MTVKLYKRLLQYVKPYRMKLILAMICMVFFALCTAGTAWLVQPTMDKIFVDKDMRMLFIIPALIIGLYLIKGVFFFGQTYLMNYVGQRIVADLREKLYHHLQYLSLSFFTKTPTGILISRITNDVNLIQGAVSNAITSVLRDSFTIITLTGVIFYQDWKLACIAFTVLPLAAIPIVKFGQKLRKFSTKGQIQMGSITSLLQETISGNRIVKAFTMEDYETRRFSAENDRFFKVVMKRQKIRALSSPVAELLGGLGVAGIMLVGGYSVIEGTSTPGTFGSFLAALLLLYKPIKNLSRVNDIVQAGLAAGSRVFELMDTTPEIRDADGAVPLTNISEGIKFEHVSFKYEDEMALKDINLAVKVGEVLALVGMSGAGKTTLVNVIPRFYDINEGRITIDGRDIKTLTIRSLREHIAIVTQQTILFNDTVRNNIAYGDITKTEREIIEAAKAANAHGFIEKLPLGYDSVIGERGVKLSGGERQRISIARALLKDAPILILDEATSSLDSKSELQVQIALERLMENRTVFLIAHRLSTIRNAHRIVVIDDGRIVEDGTHDELLAMNRIYKRLHQMQFRDDGETVLRKSRVRQIY
ncbi:MAG: lipid A export permease/ATP-binding protein MsbA [Syntrophobacterales bacterium]|nr:MAG: lipid A export permease/ATP-binding protein MsbA [Syntrophobacterales bacterium]